MIDDYKKIFSEEWFRLVQKLTSKDSFKSATPFPNFFLEHFFTEEFCRNILSEFPRFEDGDCLNELGLPGNKSSNKNFKSIGESYKLFDKLISSDIFLEDLSRLTGIEGLQYDSSYFGGGTHENRNFQNMASHIDYNYHPDTKKHRRINIIIYLNKVWDESWGGNLQLHSNPWKPAEDNIITLGCLLNNAVIFETSERSWHGFSEVFIPANSPITSRKSLALYFYTDLRPEVEIAPSHGTVYVESPLPRSVSYEDTLTLESYNLISNLIGRRESYLAYLHKRDENFSLEISDKLILDCRNYPYESYIKLVSDYLQSENDLMLAYYEKEKRASKFKELLEKNFVDAPVTSKYFWGPISSMSDVLGVYDDSWASDTISIESIYFERPVSRLRISLNYFPNGMIDNDINISFGNEIYNLGILQDGLNIKDIAFKETTEFSNFRAISTKSFSPNSINGSSDIRNLSYIINFFEFKRAG
jgi:hypothetical protein